MWQAVRAVFVLALMASPGFVLPAVAATERAAALVAAHQHLLARPAGRLDGLPLYLVTRIDRKSGIVGGEAYAVFDQPFAEVAGALGDAHQWCGIVRMHLNVKACTYASAQPAPVLTLYYGRKSFQIPDRNRSRSYALRVLAREPGYLHVEAQPVGKAVDESRQPMVIEAVPLAPRATLLRFDYERPVAGWLQLLANGYFATLGRDKVGFTAANPEGEPVRGLTAAIERQVVRIYLALLVHFDTPTQSLEARAERWFDLSERYREQLHEIERDEYLNNKRLEFMESDRLQREVDVGLEVER